YLDTALFAHHAAMLEALVLAAQALVVLDRTENLGTEQAVTLGFERPVINGFRFFDFAVRPGPDHFRRSQADANGIEVFRFQLLLVVSQQVFHVVSRPCARLKSKFQNTRNLFHTTGIGNFVSPARRKAASERSVLGCTCASRTVFPTTLADKRAIPISPAQVRC